MQASKDITLLERGESRTAVNALEIAGPLLELVAQELRIYRDVGKLCLAADLLCRLMNTAPPTDKAALDCLLSLLMSQFPKASPSHIP